MKKSLFLACLALLVSFLPPLLRRDAVPAAAEAAPAAAESVPEAAVSVPAGRRIRVLIGERAVEMELEDYLQGVVAAEMPASFEPEALKAQAVAARTYALYCAAAGKHGEADVCTDPGCCQAWQDEAALREKWGADYERNCEKLRQAAAETAGAYLSYEGRPVFAAFHASSAGATEDCGRVWSPLPYLVSVPSPESAETVPGYVSELACAPLDLRDVLLSACPEADFTGPPESWIGPLTRDGSGRVESLELGGVVFSGVRLRSLFSLRSTAFTLAYTDGYFVFTVTGHGHGVGMSQYGAEVMAAQGADYAQILAHYYPGTVLIR
ncbi:MAG: stage II sporulation protein D [Oscillospiraceae bacterium]|nr:stage II sporulation protein D [Oscillospiraceae bacterium]